MSPQVFPARFSLRTGPALPVLLLSCLLAACSAGEAEEPAAAGVPQVLTAVAQAAEERIQLRLPARADAGESARIHARATGLLGERLVDLGDRVEAGQILARIDAPELDAALRDAEAALVRARADEALAKLNFERADSLIASGAIAQEEHGDRKAGHEVASAVRASAEARLASARDRQGFRTVRAPFAGVISARNVERGDRVVGDQAGSATPLFELVALDPLRIVIDVPQSAVLQIKPGLLAEVRFPELPGVVHQAEIVRLAQRISEQAGAMRVELRLDNPGGRIPAGMLGEVLISVPRAAPVALVPLSAVVQGSKGAQVATVAADSTLAWVPVLIGRNLGTTVEVLGGLAPGTTVVLSPNALLEAGARVQARAADAS